MKVIEDKQKETTVDIDKQTFSRSVADSEKKGSNLQNVQAYEVADSTVIGKPRW